MESPDLTDALRSAMAARRRAYEPDDEIDDPSEAPPPAASRPLPQTPSPNAGRTPPAYAPPPPPMGAPPPPAYAPPPPPMGAPPPPAYAPPPPPMGAPPPPPMGAPPPPPMAAPPPPIGAPPPPPMGAPLLSRRGEAIQAMPGWSAEQSKIYQDLNDRMPKVAKAWGAGIDVMQATEQQRAEGNRFVQGSPALLNMPDELKQLHDASLAPSAKHRLAQEAFGRVEALDKFVTGVQQRDGITDAGVRKLPLLSEEQSKTYADQMERVTSIAAGYNEALKATPNDPKLQKAVMAFQRSNAFMAGMPEELKDLEGQSIDPSHRDKQVTDMLKAAEGIDQRIPAWQLDVAGYAAQQQYAPQSQTASKPGFFRRAFNAVKAFGNRVIDAVSPNRNAPPQAPATIGAPQTPAQNGKAPAAGPAPTQTQGAELPSPAVKMPPLPNRPLPPTPGIGAPPAPNYAPPAAPIATMGVEAGAPGSLAKVGNGFVAAGTVKTVEEVNGKTKLDYEFRGHDQVLAVNAVGGDGKRSPLGEAIGELKPNDNFKLAIGRDGAGIEIAHLQNHTSGKSVDVRETGIAPHVEAPSKQAQGLGRD